MNPTFTSNSQNFNRFSYVLNNPLKYVDPSGYVALNPWYEYQAGPHTKFYTWMPEFYEEYLDNQGRKWGYHGETINTPGFYGDETGMWISKLNEHNELIYSYNELRQIVQNNANSNSFFSSFSMGAGTLRVEGEGNGIASNGMENWVSDVWNWTKNHFYIGAEGEITYGLQLSGIVYKGVGLNINPVSQIVTEGKISNRDNYTNSYPIMPANRMNKGRALDFGVAWIVGGNYNWNIENGKYVSSTFSLGVYGIGGSLTWDKSGVTNLFLGFEVGGKVALVWGAGGSAKIGFNWDW